MNGKPVKTLAATGFVCMACGIALFCVVFLCDSPAYKTFVDSALQQEGTELTEFAAALFGGAAYAVVYSMGIAGFFLFTAIYLLADRKSVV